MTDYLAFLFITRPGIRQRVEAKILVESENECINFPEIAELLMFYAVLEEKARVFLVYEALILSVLLHLS